MARPPSRRVLEARRWQAVGSLREVERRQAAGEIDEAEAEALIELFADRAAVASAELEAAGGPPAERRGPERFLPVAVVAAVLALTALLVIVSQLSSDEEEPVAAIEATPQPRDLSEVTNEEMESVVEANPGVVPMRLALVERYLADGELQRAHDHAVEAADRAVSAADRHRARVLLGWTTALVDDSEEGARLLRAAVADDPQDLNARWYLANALADVGDRAGAAELLRELLDADIGDEQRGIVERRLAAL